MKFFKKTLIIAAGLLATSALATTLRVQTHLGETSDFGILYKAFAKNVETMSAGDLTLEMFYSSSVVKSTETFDAAVNGVLDFQKLRVVLILNCPSVIAKITNARAS